MSSNLDAAALALALASIVRAGKPTRRATERCAKRMLRAIELLQLTQGAATGINGPCPETGALLERTCNACGRCEAFGITRPVSRVG